MPLWKLLMTSLCFLFCLYRLGDRNTTKIEKYLYILAMIYAFIALYPVIRQAVILTY